MPELKIELDLSRLTLGDVEDVMLNEKEMTLREQIDLLDKIVTNEGGARAIPITQIQEVMERVERELADIVNPMSGNGADPESS